MKFPIKHRNFQKKDQKKRVIVGGRKEGCIELKLCIKYRYYTRTEIHMNLHTRLIKNSFDILQHNFEFHNKTLFKIQVPKLYWCLGNNDNNRDFFVKQTIVFPFSHFLLKYHFSNLDQRARINRFPEYKTRPRERQNWQQKLPTVSKVQVTTQHEVCRRLRNFSPHESVLRGQDCAQRDLPLPEPPFHGRPPQSLWVGQWNGDLRPKLLGRLGRQLLRPSHQGVCRLPLGRPGWVASLRGRRWLLPLRVYQELHGKLFFCHRQFMYFFLVLFFCRK